MNIKKTLLTFAVATAMTATAQQAPQLRADNIDEVLKAMTLDDKAVLSYCRMSSNFSSNTLFREECLYGIQRDVFHPLLVGIGKHGAAESLKVTENKGNYCCLAVISVFRNTNWTH